MGDIDFIRIFEKTLTLNIYGCNSNSCFLGIIGWGLFSGQDPETEEAEACKDRKAGTSGSIFFCGRGDS